MIIEADCANCSDRIYWRLLGPETDQWYHKKGFAHVCWHGEGYAQPDGILVVWNTNAVNSSADPSIIDHD
jgi:hypothetical protein